MISSDVALGDAKDASDAVDTVIADANRLVAAVQRAFDRNSTAIDNVSTSRLVARLREFVEELSKEVHAQSKGNWDVAGRSLRELRARLLRWERRCAIRAPHDDQDFVAALMDLEERGDKEDYDLLQEVQKNPPVSSPECTTLIERTLAGIEKRLTSEDSDVQRQAELTLDKRPDIGDSTGQPSEPDVPPSPTAQQIQQWLKQLSSQRRDARSSALTDLGRWAMEMRGTRRTRGSALLSAQAAVPEPLEVALGDLAVCAADERDRREATYVLGGLGGAAVVAGISASCYSNREPLLRAEAVSALGKIGGRAAVEALLDVAPNDSDETVRAEAMDALGNLSATTSPSDEVTQSIRACLQASAQSDVSPYVRQRAQHALSQA
jgi:hypothetical protein